MVSSLSAYFEVSALFSLNLWSCKLTSARGQYGQYSRPQAFFVDKSDPNLFVRVE